MKKILIIQQKMIGDVLVSTILCETLAKAYPDSQIDYLIYENTKDVIGDNNHSYNIIPFKQEYRNSKKELFDFAKQIRNTNYDVIIDAYSKLESWIIVAMSGAAIKISFKKVFSNFLYTHLIDRHENPTSNLGLVIEHRLKLLSPLQIEDHLIVEKPQIKISEEENKMAIDLLTKHKINIDKPIAMLNIIGSSKNKTYPSNYMALLIEEVAKNDIQIIFNYLPKQIEQAKAILEKCSKETQEKIFFDILSPNLKGLLALINQCKFVIGNDGGTMNMAKALNKPTFIIFSPWIEKKAWCTFEDNFNHISVHLNDYLPKLFENIKAKALKKNALELYKNFEFNFFKEKLSVFLKNHI